MPSAAEGKTMKVLSIHKHEQNIHDLIDQMNQDEEAYYLADVGHVRAVLLGVASYETLVLRVDRLEEEA